MKFLVIASILVFSYGCSTTGKNSKHRHTIESKAEQISAKYDRF